jgi:predicted nucleotidyltransferase
MSKQQHLNSVEDLESLIQKSGILQRFSIRRLGVFGSFARNDQANDIDLLIEDDISLEDAMRFKDELAAMVDNRLDIMLKRLANPIVMYRAGKDMHYVAG